MEFNHRSFVIFLYKIIFKKMLNMQPLCAETGICLKNKKRHKVQLRDRCTCIQTSRYSTHKQPSRLTVQSKQLARSYSSLAKLLQIVLSSCLPERRGHKADRKAMDCGFCHGCQIPIYCCGKLIKCLFMGHTPGLKSIHRREQEEGLHAVSQQ